VEHYVRAVELDPRNVDARYHLAVALRRLGRLNEAVEHYRQLLTLSPNSEVIKGELIAVERQLTVQRQ
jgi:Flp pilus assembly protein TadD